MAVSFASQIEALVGFPAKSSGSSDSQTGDDYDELTAQWMNDSIKEVMNVLPPALYDRCSTKVARAAAYTDNTGVNHESKVIGALRSIAASDAVGQVYSCRPISHLQSFRAADPDHLEYATETDPVVYFEPQADGTAVMVKILPYSALLLGRVITFDYPVFDADGSGSPANINVTSASAIPNFPDEAEHLVVIRAAIYSAQYQLAIEEDEDLYEPIIEALEKRFKQGIDGLQTKKIEGTPTKTKGLGGKGGDIGKLLQTLGKGKK